MSELTVALVAAAFGFGFRHGVDWDHIAAIGDISSTSPDRRTAFELSTIYAIAHGLVVVALGSALILAGFTVGEGLDRWLGHLVGATLLLLGGWVLLDLRRRGDDYRLRSGAMLVAAGGRRGHFHKPGGPDPAGEPSDGYGRGTASGIGVIHGVGVETPTQIALFVASTQAVGRPGGLALLGFWVAGLLAANTAIAVVAANGMHRLASPRRFHIGAGLIVGLTSVAVGALLLVGAGQVLPALA